MLKRQTIVFRNVRNFKKNHSVIFYLTACILILTITQGQKVEDFHPDAKMFVFFYNEELIIVEKN